jgi:vacuolar-type H+-ATPase subunit E/Vma4
VDFDTFYSAQQLLTDTQEQLRALPTSNAARYAALLQGLIKQGAQSLNEKEVRVTCRRDDLAIVKAAVDALKKDAELAEFSISVKETTFLPATWSVPLSCIVAAGSLYLCD